MNMPLAQLNAVRIEGIEDAKANRPRQTRAALIAKHFPKASTAQSQMIFVYYTKGFDIIAKAR